MNEWWSEQAAGLIFGIAGSVGGVLGGLLGAAAGALIPQGRGKPLVYGLFGTLVILAIASVALGLWALVGGQPRHVWMPPLLVGGVTLVSILPSGLCLPRWYRQAEQRRLEAGEFRRSL